MKMKIAKTTNVYGLLRAMRTIPIMKNPRIADLASIKNATLCIDFYSMNMTAEALQSRTAGADKSRVTAIE